MDDIKINLNDQVKVKLTDKGIEILKERHKELNRMLSEYAGKIEPFKLMLDKEGYYHTQLWHLFEAFGNEMYLGCAIPFENNAIEVVENEKNN